MSASGSSGIERDGAAWAVLRETRGQDPEFLKELDAWLAEDPRRAGELLRAEAALSYLDRGGALAGHRGEPFPDHAPFLPVSRRLLLAGAGAGVMTAAAAGLVLLWPNETEYTTGVGEVREVALEDGSTAAINTDSRIYAKMSAHARELRLAKGEAWFHVRKNPAQPFVVEAAGLRVRAVGTAFSVRRSDDHVEVLVTEGVVESWMDDDRDRRVRVVAGSRLVAGPGLPQQVMTAPDEVRAGLAWREGMIVLNGMALGDAATEFNRYNKRKIVILSAGLAHEKMVGEFRMREPEAFAHALTTTLDARVTEDGDNILIQKGSTGPS